MIFYFVNATKKRSNYRIHAGPQKSIIILDLNCTDIFKERGMRRNKLLQMALHSKA